MPLLKPSACSPRDGSEKLRAKSSEEKRIVWRCRRGMRELDILLLRYAEGLFPKATEVERAAFEHLLSMQDPDIHDLLAGRVIAQDAALRNVVQRILDKS